MLNFLPLKQNNVLIILCLYTILAYQDNLSKKAGIAICDFDKAIEFLEVTSTLITNLTSHQPYTSMADPRLEENDRCLQWLKSWRSDVEKRKDLKASERNKQFLSQKSIYV
jgi:hypothetical protein